MTVTAPKLLLVEDDVALAELLEYRFESEGYEVRVTGDGDEALVLASEDAPDLVILDWMMPNLSGLDTLKGIREHFDANRLPVIMCTARDEESSIGAAMDAGANDYVQKPIRMPVLLARISAQLIRKAAVEALGTINSDLEETLAQRTRLLFEQRTAEQK